MVAETFAWRNNGGRRPSLTSERWKAWKWWMCLQSTANQCTHDLWAGVMSKTCRSVWFTLEQRTLGEKFCFWAFVTARGTQYSATSLKVSIIPIIQSRTNVLILYFNDGYIKRWIKRDFIHGCCFHIALFHRLRTSIYHDLSATRGSFLLVLTWVG